MSRRTIGENCGKNDPVEICTMGISHNRNFLTDPIPMIYIIDQQSFSFSRTSGVNSPSVFFGRVFVNKFTPTGFLLTLFGLKMLKISPIRLFVDSFLASENATKTLIDCILMYTYYLNIQYI